MSTRQAHVREASSRHNGMVYLMLLVLAVAFGGVLWQSTQQRDIPHVEAPSEPYKVRPPEGVFDTRDPGESQGDFLDTSQRDELRPDEPRLGELRRDELRRGELRPDELRRDGRRWDDLRRDEPRRDERRWDELRRGELEIAQPELRQPRWSPAGAPYFVANGPYVAQVEALQSEAGVEEAWRRLSLRAPELFESARLDVERADLGPRGVFYRIRAGYFPDYASASRFCERVERMGQDCHVTGR